jgi:hypothetical protein
MRERWTLEREKDRKFQLPAMISRNLLHIFSHCGIKHRACTITRGILAKPRGAYRTFSHGWAFTPNLEKLAVSSTVSACGEEGSGGRRKLATKPASVKQEPNAVCPLG